MFSQNCELLLGSSRTFEATDSDLHSTKILDQMTPVPSSLVLKVGAQVMLMKNLNVSDGMVNGARGVITSFSDKGRILISVYIH
jgi:ATP-dependent DNA helicase PIF1